ncbi:hypothetical protein D5071_18520 [Pectobacterium carotovorum]|uniref:Uncharacterized protein n=1 Tax=Pectobacterium carotovorum TaxID=554 RepID=A0A419AS67_PECCA|nr:hypothetical protein D5071_18520 [Pectobacterium carotovorum]
MLENQCATPHTNAQFFDAIIPFPRQFWRGFAPAAQLHKNALFSCAGVAGEPSRAEGDKRGMLVHMLLNPHHVAIALSRSRSIAASFGYCVAQNRIHALLRRRKKTEQPCGCPA